MDQKKKNKRSLSGMILCIAFMLCPVFALAQRTVTGVVSDSEGPLIGATVTIKDATGAGAITDSEGKYSIKVPSNKAYLRVSYTGYETQLVAVGNRKEINVVLKEDERVLDNVVVIGYGTQQKSHLTGSISKISGEKIASANVSDLTNALQGAMTGLSVNNTTSEVGVSPTIRVRGTGSISADSAPLVIVDGFPISGGLSSLNASDIQSIEILKDASSAAIYGSRAANGVIMVTTKSGSVDKPKYTFKLYQGFKYAYRLHDLMSSSEVLDLFDREAELGGPKVTAAARAQAYLERQYGATDWQREGLNSSASTTNIQGSVQGGSKNLRYFFSAAYTKDQGIMRQNELDKLNFRGKVDAKLSSRTSLGFNMAGNYQYATRPKNNFIDFYRTPSFLPVRHNEYTTDLTKYSGFARGSHFNNIELPTGPVDDYGEPTMEKSSPFSSANNNPRSVMENTTRWSEVFQGQANMYLSVELIKGLTFRTSNGLTARFAPQYYYGNVNATKDGEASTATYFSTLFVDLLTENTLNYKFKLGRQKEHNFDLLVGYTAQNTRQQRVAETATGFATDNVHTLNAATVFSLASSGNGNTDGTGTFRYPDTVLESYLGRATYDYLGRYLLSASLRLDRSSLFASGNRNAWFPSVSLGWRASEEKFMQPFADTVSNLKFRVSYGVTGNNRIAYNASMELLNNANYVTGSGNGTLVSGAANLSSTLANNNITWEKTDEWNFGLDLGLLRGRINLAVDAYYSITRALLFEQPTQTFTGFSKFWNNIGKVRNSGLEIQLDLHNIKTRNFEWDTNINFSMSRNRLLEIGGEQQVITQGERNECYIARVGEPLIQYFGYRTDGVWKSQAEIDANPHFSADVPGGMRIVDTNKDGKLTAEDRVPLGNPYPDFTWGMTNTLTYKNFDLSFLIQGVQGIDVYNGDVYYNETVRYNRAYTANRWVSETAVGDGMTPYQKNGYNLCLTDYPLENASYACLRNLTIGYTLPMKAVRKLGLNNLRIYAQGNNLLYIWGGSYRGINPESRMTSGVYSSAMISGYQRGGFPLTSTISAGIDINF